MDLARIREKIKEDPILSKLSWLSKRKNVSLYLVGGYIRDFLLGVERRDYDFALPGESFSFIKEIEEALSLRFFKVGKYRTVAYRAVQPRLSIDLTFIQGSSIREDLLRRDFTVNAIAFSMKDESFEYIERSLQDLRDRVIRAASRGAIDQDPLRMLRAIRYASTLEGFTISEELKEEIGQKKELIRRVAGERIKTELDLILLSARAADGLNYLKDLGLLLSLFPVFGGLEKLPPGDYHHLDALLHTIQVIEKLRWACDWLASRDAPPLLGKQERLALSYAALFHDIGKKFTYSEDDEGRIHFYNHELQSCIHAEQIMERLRFSNPLKKKVLQLVKNHMRILNLSTRTKEPALRRLVNRMGDLTPLLVILTLADKEAARGPLSTRRDDTIECYCLKIMQLFRLAGVVNPPPLISGHDVMALGIPSGPKVGEILKVVRRMQVSGEIRTREEALKFLNDHYR